LHRICADSEEQTSELGRESVANTSIGPPLDVLICQCRSVDGAVSVVDDAQKVVDEGVYTISRKLYDSGYIPVIDLGGIACKILSTALEVVTSAGESFRAQAYT
jgi:hypothetical protein